MLFARAAGRLLFGPAFSREMEKCEGLFVTGGDRTARVLGPDGGWHEVTVEEKILAEAAKRLIEDTRHGASKGPFGFIDVEGHTIGVYVRKREDAPIDAELVVNFKDGPAQPSFKAVALCSWTIETFIAEKFSGARRSFFRGKSISDIVSIDLTLAAIASSTTFRRAEVEYERRAQLVAEINRSEKFVAVEKEKREHAECIATFMKPPVEDISSLWRRFFEVAIEIEKRAPNAFTTAFDEMGYDRTHLLLPVTNDFIRGELSGPITAGVRELFDLIKSNPRPAWAAENLQAILGELGAEGWEELKKLLDLKETEIVRNAGRGDMRPAITLADVFRRSIEVVFEKEGKKMPRINSIIDEVEIDEQGQNILGANSVKWNGQSVPIETAEQKGFIEFYGERKKTELPIARVEDIRDAKQLKERLVAMKGYLERQSILPTKIVVSKEFGYTAGGKRMTFKDGKKLVPADR